MSCTFCWPLHVFFGSRSPQKATGTVKYVVSLCYKPHRCRWATPPCTQVWAQLWHIGSLAAPFSFRFPDLLGPPPHAPTATVKSTFPCSRTPALYTPLEFKPVTGSDPGWDNAGLHRTRTYRTHPAEQSIQWKQIFRRNVRRFHISGFFSLLQPFVWEEGNRPAGEVRMCTLLRVPCQLTHCIWADYWITSSYKIATWKWIYSQWNPEQNWGSTVFRLALKGISRLMVHVPLKVLYR